MSRIEFNESTKVLASSQVIGKSVTPLQTKPFSKVMESLSSGFLPPMVRWFDPTKRFWVIELQPRWITVSHGIVIKNYQELRQKNITIPKQHHINQSSIPIPWQVYFFDMQALSRFRIWFRPAALSSLDDTVYHSFMSNTYADDIPCSLTVRNGGKDLPPMERMFAAMQSYWMSNFCGGHYIYSSYGNRGITPGLPTQLKTLLDESEWESKNFYIAFMYVLLADLDIETVLSWDYIPAGTLQEYVDAALKQISYPHFLTATGLK